jgi:hypothetical protein
MTSLISIQLRSGPLTQLLESIWRYGSRRHVLIDTHLARCVGSALRKWQHSCTLCLCLSGLPHVLVPCVSVSISLCSPDVRLSVSAGMIHR